MDEAHRVLEQLKTGDYPEAWQQTKVETPKVEPMPTERGVLDADTATHLVGMLFQSRSGNATPHIVTEGFDGVPRCTCRATHTCWGVKSYCRVKGIATP